VGLEVERPNLVGTLGAKALAICVIADPGALSLATGNSQTLLAPEALHALAVDAPALLEQAGVGAAVAPAGLLFGDLAQGGAQGGVVLCGLRLVALRGAVLPRHLACPALADAETVT